MDLFHENVILVHCLVAVCIQYFLYHKECTIISEFSFTVLCGLAREKRLTKHKAICTCLLDCTKYSRLNSSPSPDPLVV